jgi:hypothetical protein
LEQRIAHRPQETSRAEARLVHSSSLEIARSRWDLVIFNLAIDSNLRACDLVKLRLDDICVRNQTFPKHHGCRVVWIGLFRVQPLMLERRQALRTLLRANKRLSTAHLPQDFFGQLQSYAHLCWARRAFRELARIAQVATIEAVPEIRRDENNGRELPPAQSSELNGLTCRYRWRRSRACRHQDRCK